MKKPLIALATLAVALGAAAPAMARHQVCRDVEVKQINSKDHYTGQRCIECHSPHQPNEVP